MHTLPRLRDRLNEYELNHQRQGSHPVFLTARGKKQGTHARLHAQIERELRLRMGAENLFKATSNQKLRETVAQELRCVNSNLQLLKEELASLSSPVNISQDFSAVKNVPMIPLGLKEWKDVDLKGVFREYIKEHYHEDGLRYSVQLQQFTELRQAVQTPMRNETGVEQLTEYYNQLYFIDKRFFPSNSHHSIQFEWFDSLTGVPSSQRTVGFEKGSVLFNIGALETQIAARQDRTSREGTDAAADSFQKAAGAFKYLSANFSHAPSVDMQAPTLAMLIQLMLSQAQECLFETMQLVALKERHQHHCNTAHEAAKVSAEYTDTHSQMLGSAVTEHIPAAWLNMVNVKVHYFRALAHYHCALAVAGQAESVDIIADQLSSLHTQESGRRHCSLCNVLHKDDSQRRTFIRSHLRSAILAFEDALRLHKSFRQLCRIDTLQSMLKRSHVRCLQKFAEFDDEDDFTELLSAPSIQPLTASVATAILPDFSKSKADDLFHELGPLNIFSARHKWTASRCVTLQRTTCKQEFGFSVRGDSPVIVTSVDQSSLAQREGMRAGDFIAAVGCENVKWSCHTDVIALIRAAGDSLALHLVTPLDCNYLEPPVPCSPPAVTRMQGTLKKGDIRAHSHTKSWTSGGSWKLRKRRSKSRDLKTERNVIVNGKH